MPTLIKPFCGLRPAPGQEAGVIAPPYDVLNSAEARERARGKPHSFLHISKPEIDLAADIDPYDPQVYAQGAASFRRMIEAGVLVRDPAPCYYVYRLRMGEHVQTGLVCTGSVAAYDDNRIRKHEFTRPDKEDDRVRQITALRAQTGPVLLAYRSQPTVRELLAGVAAGQPACDVMADDGIAHTLWHVADTGTIAQLTQAFDAMASLYIADGHHRSASASRVAAMLREGHAEPTGEEPYEYFLCVAFPHDEMKILDYNRVVRDLHGLTPDALLERIAEKFSIEDSPQPARPRRPGEYGLYLGGRWRRLAIRPQLIPADPVARLDVSLLQQHVLDPLLGIADPRTDKRIDFVGGMRGLA
ncbi:MAG: DUF1015 domain-containing protein, partial [Gammaproteobacteria bacterium]|nr:DUF1015 domain-containing protein [Gammaproteobacteria bacterium]